MSASSQPIAVPTGDAQPPSEHSSAVLRRAHQSVAILFFVCGFGFSNWLSRIPTVRDGLSLSDRTLGLLLLCTGIGSMGAFRMAGPLVRRFGSRTVGLVGTGAFCIVLNGPPGSPTALWAAISLLFLGFAAGFMDVAMNIQAVEVERHKRVAILATLHGICSLGGLMGAGTGAGAAYLDMSASLHMVAITLPLLVITLWAGAGLLPASAATAQKPGKSGRPQGLILLLGAIGFCSSVGEGGIADWLGVYLHENLNTSVGTAGMGFAVYSLAMVIGRFSCDRVSANILPRYMVRASGLVVTAGLTFGLIIDTPWALMFAAVTVGFGLAPIIPAILRAGGQLPNVPPSQALPTLATMSYAGFLFGPPSIGLLSEYIGLRLSLGLVVLLAVVLTGLAQGMPKPRFVPAAEAPPPEMGPDPTV
jgi:MFS family permease